MICPEVSMRLGFLHSFRRSPALGSIAVPGLGMLRIFVSFIFFLQLCRYHSFCHCFCGPRGDEFFIHQGASKLFIDFCAPALVIKGGQGRRQEGGNPRAPTQTTPNLEHSILPCVRTERAIKQAEVIFVSNRIS